MDRTTDRHYRATPQLQRAALELLRPELASIWVDSAPGPGGWPDEVAPAAAEAARQAEWQTRCGHPRRPGHPPSVAALQALDDAAFELALTLAPSTARLEAMSRSGRLVLSRTPDTDLRLRLRLTDAQRDGLAERGPLTRTRRLPDARGHSWNALSAALAAILWLRLAMAVVDDWAQHHGWLGLLLIVTELGVLSAMAVGAVLFLAARLRDLAGSSRLRRRRAGSPPG